MTSIGLHSVIDFVAVFRRRRKLISHLDRECPETAAHIPKSVRMVASRLKIAAARKEIETFFDEIAP